MKRNMTWQFLGAKVTPFFVLKSCKSLKQGLQVHAQVIVNGLANDIFDLSRLIEFFALSGSRHGLDHSRIVFSCIDRPNIFMYNTMLRGYSRSDSPFESIVIFKSMVSNGVVFANNFTFPFLINSCAKLSSVELGKEVHCCVIKNGYESDLFIRNSLIHFYANFGYLDCAKVLFGESSERDVVSFNTMMNCYVKHGRPSDVFCLFGEMKNSGVEFDEFTIVAMLSACSLLSDYKAGKQIHLLICKNFKSGDCNVFLKGALLDMYAKCGLMEMARRVFSSLGSKKSTTAWSSMVLGYARRGEIEIARRYFDQIFEKDLVSWTIMINGYAQMGRYTEALEIFVQMEDMGLKPDETILVAALSACARLGALGFGKRLHQQYIEDGLFDENLILTTSIVDMYAKCGSVDAAIDIFHGVQEKSKTVSLYNALIYGLAQHGLGEAVLRAFKDMESADLTPDEITFIGVLCACSHGGLVEEGKRIFDSMLDVHRIRPQVEHYCCMVDLLGRSGHVKEAYDFIKEMPFDPNSVIWRSLLGSCKIHSNIEVGVIAAERLLKVDPDHGARYVVLSNMLTDANRWEDAGRVRKLMEAKGISKPHGWSCIEANGTLHRFQASDKSHPQTKEIDIMLEDIAARLKSAGYVPDTTHVSFDISEEEKGTVVTYHSEKLALAFALINLDPKATIPIVKNLRICGDCHLVFKLCSKIYRRDLVVRDTIRFHHFKNGVCSCKDFW